MGPLQTHKHCWQNGTRFEENRFTKQRSTLARSRLQGYVTIEQARGAFVAFAEASGILSPDVDQIIAAHAVARSYDGFAS